MADRKRKRTQKVGASPGTLAYPEGTLPEHVKLNVIDYDPNNCAEKQLDRVEECFPYRDTPSITWIDVEGSKNLEVLQRVGEHFGVHPLVLEDIISGDQRPKFEDHGDYLFIVARMLRLIKPKASDSFDVDVEQVSFIVGKNFVISFQHGREGDVFPPVRERIRAGRGRIRKMGTDYLVYALVDCIVDNYFVVLERLEDRLSQIDDQVLSDTESDTLKAVYALKKEILFIRKAIWPLREAVTSMQKSESDLIGDSTELFFRDLHDHLSEASDQIETFRDIGSGLADIYLTSAGHKTNQVIQFLTIIASVFIPLTFIVGIYGMNFEYMPELKSPYGYPMVMCFMLIVALVLMAFFKRKKWI